MTEAAGDTGRREVRQAVAELVRTRPGLVEDQERLRGYLRDVCPLRPAEVTVIVVAAGAGVPDELARADQGHALEALSARLANRLQLESGIDGELARWAVDTWSLALRPAGQDIASAPAPDALRAMVAGAKTPAPGAGTPGGQVTTPPPAPPVVGPTRAPPAPAPAPEAPNQTVHRRPAPEQAAAPAAEAAPSWRARARSPVVLGGAAAATLVLVLIVVALAGGGSDPPPASDAASVTTAPAITSAPATTAPAPTTVATTTTLPAAPFPAAPATLNAGRYAASTFQPNLTVAVPDGWRLGTHRTDLLELTPADSDSDVLSVVKASRPLRRDRTFPTGPDTQGAGAVEPAPADFVAWLRSHDRLSVSQSTAVTVGGLAATQVDVTLRAGYARDFCGRCVSILQLDDGIVFNLLEANVSRIYAFTAGGAQILVVLEAPPDRIQAFASRVDAIVRSLAFTR